jgi:hypothetical protein
MVYDLGLSPSQSTTTSMLMTSSNGIYSSKI